MAELRVGHGTDLYTDYKTKALTSENLDIEVRLENGDVISINTRKQGYALRIHRKGEAQKDILNVDFQKRPVSVFFP